MMKNSLILNLLLAALSLGCIQKNNPKSESKETPEFLSLKDKNTEAVLNDYLQLKNALVRSDSVEAAAFAGNLAVHLKLVPAQGDIFLTVQKLQNSKTLKSQREAFALLATPLSKMVETAGVNEGKVFIQYCPMAQDSGAYWLSGKAAVRNPYYGDEMLECGEVKSEIKSK